MLNAKVQCAKRLSKYSMFGEGEGIFALKRMQQQVKIVALHLHKSQQGSMSFAQT